MWIVRESAYRGALSMRVAGACVCHCPCVSVCTVCLCVSDSVPDPSVTMCIYAFVFWVSADPWVRNLRVNLWGSPYHSPS